jgi:hypothetical protein
MILTHDLGKSLELGKAARAMPLWRYVYGGKPKPFFHPVCTPSGHVLSLFEPHDHLWQRGLWCAIKYVNGENFWEEKDDEPWGTQRTVLPVEVRSEGDGSISVSSRLNWVRSGGETILEEDRRFVYRAVNERSYALDFTFAITPVADVVLDRTVFTTWGGYGGLTFRGNRNWQETRLLFSDGSTNDRPTGITADWCDLSGKIDGGAGVTGGIAMFDHPDNPRHPTPWYGATGPNHYFNAAFLFHEPMKVAAKTRLELRYRVVVHDGMLERDELSQAYVGWVHSPTI